MRSYASCCFHRHKMSCYITSPLVAIYCSQSTSLCLRLSPHEHHLPCVPSLIGFVDPNSLCQSCPLFIHMSVCSVHPPSVPLYPSYPAVVHRLPSGRWATELPLLMCHILPCSSTILDAGNRRPTSGEFRI